MPKQRKIKKSKSRRSGRLPDRLAELSRVDRHEPEAEPLRISYGHYDDNLCECNSLQLGHLRGAFRVLRNTGKCFAPYQFKGQSIVARKVRGYDSSYRKLWAKQPPDVDIWEIVLNQTGGQRIFYWHHSELNTMYLVCIRDTHL